MEGRPCALDCVRAHVPDEADYSTAWAKSAAALARQVDYTKFALFFNHTEPHWLAEVPGGVQWQLDPDGPHPDHPTDAHWCDST